MNELASNANPSPDPRGLEPRPDSMSPSVRWVFIGPQGLRAGWRLAVYAAAFLALARLFALIASPFLPPANGAVPPLWVFFVGECEVLLAAIVPALVLSHIENRPFGNYGLPLHEAIGKNFWMGALWGLLAITLLLLVMRGIGVFYFGGLALHGFRVLKFAGFFAVLFLIVGLFEEFAFRGYAQFTLAQGIGFWPAAIALSALFGLSHSSNQGEAWIGELAAGLLALFLCLTLRRTGNLWFAVGIHAAWDWGETFLYSVPDSGIVVPGHLLRSSFHGSPWLTGGTVGPEGSVLIFGVLIALWITFDSLYPASKALGLAREPQHNSLPAHDGHAVSGPL
ncbi:MAG TPA: CPBP family intramembrane glutamic endopeptidase [Terriglobales bacterium]